MIEKELYLSLDDVAIIPAITSPIEHRSDCDVRQGDTLPIFTAPMNCIVDDKNYDIYNNYDIIPIIPRGVPLETRKQFFGYQWVALSLKEFEEIFINETYKIRSTTIIEICIDCANGNMKRLLNKCREAKEKYFHRLQIMTGNIANPETYIAYCEAKIDYVRVGIGGGAACTTSVNTGIHYPMATLLNDINSLRRNIPNSPKVIADGGISTYGQAIKALALGADYIMLGKMFAECEECGTSPVKTFIFNKFNSYYGMSTVKAQRENDKNLEYEKIEEGFFKYIKITKTLGQFVREFSSYLASTLSYCGVSNLKSFIGKARLIHISNNSFQQYAYSDPINKKQPNNSYYEDNSSDS